MKNGIRRERMEYMDGMEEEKKGSITVQTKKQKAKVLSLALAFLMVPYGSLLLPL